MNTVGMLAGRGDVIIAMGFAWVIGLYMGWKLRTLLTRFTTWRATK